MWTIELNVAGHRFTNRATDRTPRRPGSPRRRRRGAHRRGVRQHLARGLSRAA